ncbi:MAG: hypothetical protein KJZ59_00765 [Pararhodobacter sp.]|nr:hypothetical protein [Pararhodobacter sp.]
MTLSRLLPLVLVSACSLAQPERQATPADRLAAECRLLEAAAARMEAPHAGLREGCPGETARDTRPLPAQTASLRAANAAPLPPGIDAGTRAETVFRRMITRGVPVALAATLVQSDDFAAATR